MERANRVIHDIDIHLQDEEALMTVKELSDYLEVKEESITEWINESKLKSKAGKDGELRYSKADMIHFLRGVRDSI